MLSRSIYQRSIRICNLRGYRFNPATRSFVTKGLQDERTKKVIEEIKELEYKLESKKKKQSASFEKFNDEEIAQVYRELSAPMPIRPKISNDYLEKLRVKFLDTRNHQIEGLATPVLTDGSFKEQPVASPTVTENDTSVGQYKLSDFENLIYVNSLAKRPQEAEQAFQLMERYDIQPSVKAVNHLMDAYANVNDLEKTISTFRKIEECGLKPDVFTFGTLVKAFVTNNRLDDALVILDKIKTFNITPSQPIFSTLINACLKANKVGKAWELFDSMRLSYHQPDEVSFTMMLHACAKRGEVERALNLFEEMAGLGLYPTDVTFNVLINACAKRPDYYTEAFSLLEQMQTSYGFQPDKITFNTLLTACARKKDLRQARIILQTMWRDVEKHGEESLLVPDSQTFTNLFWCYASFNPHTAPKPTKQQKQTSSSTEISTERNMLPNTLPYKNTLVVQEAEQIFNQVKNANFEITSALLTAYMSLHISQKSYSKAKSIYVNAFDKYSVKKNAFTFMQILGLCYKTKDDELAWKVWEDYQSFLEERSKPFVINDEMTILQKKAISSERLITSIKEGWTIQEQQKIAVLMSNTLARSNDLKNAIGILTSELNRLPDMKPVKFQDMLPTYNKCIQLEDEEHKKELVRLCRKEQKRPTPFKYTRVNS